MSRIYLGRPPLDRNRIARGLGGGAPVAPEKPAYVPPTILDLTPAQQALICGSADCAAWTRPSGQPL